MDPSLDSVKGYARMATVLLVEDERDLARVIIRELEAAGYKIQHVADGQQALKAHA